MISTPSRSAFVTKSFSCAFLVVSLVASAATAQQTFPIGNQYAAGKDLKPLTLPPLPRKEQPKKKFGDWTQQCDSRPGAVEKRCFISQSVVGNKDQRKQNLLGITVGNFGPDKKLGIVFRAPVGFGIFLPTGFKFNVPGVEATQIGIQFCLPQGCSATRQLSPELVAAMKKAEAGSLELQNIRKRVIRIPISFKGFTAALASLNDG